MKRFICALFAVLPFALLFMGSIAFGADAAAAQPAWGDALYSFLTQTVFPVLGALTLGIVSWAAKKFGDKFHIQGLGDQNSMLMQLASQGVAFAEEKGANFAKNAQPITSNDKLNSAIAYVMQMAPKVTTDQAQSLVTAALAMVAGVGATGQTTVGTALTPNTPAAPDQAPASPATPLQVAP